MRSRHPFADTSLPRLWLMTDERMGERLLPSVAALPQGSGVIFRHHATPLAERRKLFRKLRRIADARWLLLLLAGDAGTAIRWGADGIHVRGGRADAPARARAARRYGLVVTQSVHDEIELHRANRGGAAPIISPVFATRSHGGSATLGTEGFAALARRAKAPAIALGGMTPARFAQLPEAWGWAAIDALTVER